MRTEWGKLAQSMRIRAGLSQTEFAQKLGVSLARISNLEAGRTNISDEVLGSYIQILAASNDEALRLRELARYSNEKRRASGNSQQSLVALFSAYGDRLSEDTIKGIRRLVEKELGADVANLKLKSSRQPKRSHGTRQRKSGNRASIGAQRFIEISFIAEQIRRKHCNNSDRLHIDRFLEAEVAEAQGFDFLIVDKLPAFAEQAFAVIVGDPDSNTILLEEERFKLAQRGSSFVRHVIAHEYGHHILHKEHLEADLECFLPPQDWAKASAKELKAAHASAGQIEKVVDTLVEAEAECFSTMLLVPWTEFMKGTETYHLAKDFGEEHEEVKRYHRYIRGSDRVRMTFEAEIASRR